MRKWFDIDYFWKQVHVSFLYFKIQLSFLSVKDEIIKKLEK